MRRGECKTPGGKLVAVGVDVDEAGRATACRIDGDFFIEGTNDACDALLRDIERALLFGDPVDGAIARHGEARLVGTDAQAIATAFARAMNRSEHSDGAAGIMGRQEPVADEGIADETNREVMLGESDGEGTDGAYGVGVHGMNGHDANAGDVNADDVNADDVNADDARARWEALARELVVTHDRPRPPAEQMALDEQWAREVAAGTRPATLRFWEWAAPCVVIGRFQSEPDEVNLDVARDLGFSVVRRCTGGGAMFIEPGNTITYSLYAPLWFVEGIDIEESYRLCDRWLVEALRKLGVDARFSGLNDIASQSGKIGGAAQRRFPRPRTGVDASKRAEVPHEGAGATIDDPRSVASVAPVEPAVPAASAAPAASAGDSGAAGEHADINGGMGAVLHHVTLSYDIDAQKMGRVLNTSREKMRDKAVKSAVKRVDPLKRQTGFTRDELVNHLIGEFGVSGLETGLM
ncbi:ligase [Bifidobacterium lemurum]|uniref:Ligase n=2 Tax=Bifidobacterium lemurum TaxID=1603886 RepID=A0A261FQ31_9BIFI|nr:lipoate--protein ligase family protein [Bifidobacterium lemurum]OZG61290.1 ligase [Bifidobacterium lemurum]